MYVHVLCTHVSALTVNFTAIENFPKYEREGVDVRLCIAYKASIV